MKRITKKMKLAAERDADIQRRLNVQLKYILGLYKIGGQERHIEVESHIIFNQEPFSFLGV